MAARKITASAVSGRSEARQAAAANQQLKSAEALVRVLGGMRGAAMKVGQTLSTVDMGLVREEVRPRFQEILASLQQEAEPVSFKAVAKVVTRTTWADGSPTTFGTSPRSRWHLPRSARSIGRPPAMDAMSWSRSSTRELPRRSRPTSKTCASILKLLDVVAPGINTGAIADEIRERISEELDYELEAANQRAMARAYRDHPFIVVPEVVIELCRERVIVSDFVDGERFAEARKRSQPERDRLGEILVRFYVNGPLRHRLLNGDPILATLCFSPTAGSPS